MTTSASRMEQIDRGIIDFLKPTGWIPPAFVSEKVQSPVGQPVKKESKHFSNMTAAEQKELQNKMNVLHKLGFFIDEDIDCYPAITHKAFEGELSFNLSNLELEDFIPLIYRLGRNGGWDAGRRALKQEITEAEPARGWDDKGNHYETGTKYDRHGFTRDGIFRDGGRYDKAGYDIQGLDRSGQCGSPF